MPKKANEEDYRRAIAVLRGEFIPVDPTDESPGNEDGGLSIILVSTTPSPEQIVIRKDLFEKLSEEAQEVINTVLNGPTEVVDQFASPIRKRISKKRVYNHYSRILSSRYIAKSLIDEITKWANTLK